MPGCENTESEFVNPSFIKIYFLNPDQPNIRVFDIKATDDNGLLVFGVTNTKTVSSRFEGDGSLYIQKIDASGTTQWFEIYDNYGKGFPTEILESSEGYTLFWNSELGSELKQLTISGNHTTPMNISAKNIDLGYTFYKSYITAIAETFDQQGIILLGIGQHELEGELYNRTFITEINGTDTAKLAQNEFIYEPASNIYTMIKEFSNYFYLGTCDNRYLFHSPAGLLYAGEEIPVTPVSITPDSYYGALVVEASAAKDFAMVVWNGENTMFVPEIDSYRTYDDLENFERTNLIFNIDRNTKTLITQVQGNMLVAGTSTSGEVMLCVFSPETGELLTTRFLGQTYRYEVAGIETLDNGNTLAIVGTTQVEYEDQRVFVIKIPTSELLK